MSLLLGTNCPPIRLNALVESKKEITIKSSRGKKIYALILGIPLKGSVIQGQSYIYKSNG